MAKSAAAAATTRDNFPIEVPTTLTASRLGMVSQAKGQALPDYGMVEVGYTTQYGCYDIYQTSAYSLLS